MKSIEDRIAEELKKIQRLEESKDAISLKIKEKRGLVKSLEKEKKKQEGEVILRRIEATGLTVEDVLKIMEQKYSEEEK